MASPLSRKGQLSSKGTKVLEVVGMKELDKVLKDLPGEIQRKVLKSATNAAATPVLKTARNLAAQGDDTGLLAESLGKKSKLYKRAGVAFTVVGPKKGFKRKVKVRLPRGIAEAFFSGKTQIDVWRNPINYAHLVEGFKSPAKPHPIPNFLGTGITIMHPGITRTRPFMRPAWDQNQHIVIQRFSKFAGKRIEREGKKLGRRHGATR